MIAHATLPPCPFRRIVESRDPDRVIGTDGKPYMNRWYIRRGAREAGESGGFNVYLHEFVRSDDPRALHDHPWASVAILLRGSYREWVPWPEARYEFAQIRRRAHDLHMMHPEDYRLVEGYPHLDCRRVLRREHSITYRRAEQLHRVELIRDADGIEQPVWSLFITGPKVRDWGFACPRGWRPWREFTTPDGNGVGRGCG